MHFPMSLFVFCKTTFHANSASDLWPINVIVCVLFIQFFYGFIHLSPRTICFCLLQDESLTYLGQLDSLEAEILKQRKVLHNLQVTSKEAQLAKEAAEVSSVSRGFSLPVIFQTSFFFVLLSCLFLIPPG